MGHTNIEMDAMHAVVRISQALHELNQILAKVADGQQRVASEISTLRQLVAERTNRPWTPGRG
jgi:hypothetical protein